MNLKLSQPLDGPERAPALSFDIASLKRPNFPAYTQIASTFGTFRDDRNVGLQAFRISTNPDVDGVFWKWIFNPSRDQQEIFVRQSCIAELVERGPALADDLAALTDSLYKLKSRVIWLGGYDKESNLSPPPPNIERILNEQAGEKGVRDLIELLDKEIPQLNQMLDKFGQSKNPLLRSAAKQLRESIDAAPKITNSQIDEALQGETLVISAARIHDLYEPRIAWADKVAEDSWPLQALLCFSLCVQAGNLCKVRFTSDKEHYSGL